MILALLRPKDFLDSTGKIVDLTDEQFHLLQDGLNGLEGSIGSSPGMGQVYRKDNDQNANSHALDTVELETAGELDEADLEQQEQDELIERIVTHLVIEGYDEKTSELLMKRMATPDALRQPHVLTAQVKTALSIIKTTDQLAEIGHRTWESRIMPAIRYSVRHCDSAVLADSRMQYLAKQDLVAMSAQDLSRYANLENRTAKGILADHNTMGGMPGQAPRIKDPENR